jgi:hypothetical protein
MGNEVIFGQMRRESYYKRLVRPGSQLLAALLSGRRIVAPLFGYQGLAYKVRANAGADICSGVDHGVHSYHADPLQATLGRRTLHATFHMAVDKLNAASTSFRYAMASNRPAG